MCVTVYNCVLVSFTTTESGRKIWLVEYSSVPHPVKVVILLLSSLIVATIVFGPGPLAFVSFQILQSLINWLQSLKQFFINLSYNILVASLSLMALF